MSTDPEPDPRSIDPEPDPGNSPPEDWTEDLDPDENEAVADRLQREDG